MAGVTATDAEGVELTGLTFPKVLKPLEAVTVTVGVSTQGPVQMDARYLFDALGIGAFGPTGVNPASPDYGWILETPKTAWKHFDLLGAFKSLDIPMGYDTDVNVACLGEVTYVWLAFPIAEIVGLTFSIIYSRKIHREMIDVL